ncbi:epididymal sperm-binding protein 1 [Misgurnus anguillicaudatus]|uniref:epididymal sperm-binding protein 1 n=1 Tax=Misgurnus anguillicaudatus TaxID=75329 RepID=UPI002434D2B8|nr:matrix metalloproteinase-9-like [Misgurnus anguillicaudatus]
MKIICVVFLLLLELSNFAQSEIYTTGGNANGRPCHFPFLYKNIWYADCTKVDSDILWCAVEPDYSSKGLWGYCKTYDRIYTIGGNAHGRPCHFPFLYKEKWYADCTNIDSNSLWCAVEPDFSSKGLWGHCPTDDSNKIYTIGGNANGRPCHFPFLYKNIRYADCTKVDSDILWCAVEPDYSSKGLWGYCPTYDKIYTIGGNANGGPCHFPFRYKEKWYAGCTNIDSDSLWCAVEPDYSSNGLWGYCKTQ